MIMKDIVGADMKNFNRGNKELQDVMRNQSASQSLVCSRKVKGLQLSFTPISDDDRTRAKRIEKRTAILVDTL